MIISPTKIHHIIVRNDFTAECSIRKSYVCVYNRKCSFGFFSIVRIGHIINYQIININVNITIALMLYHFNVYVLFTSVSDILNVFLILYRCVKIYLKQVDFLLSTNQVNDYVYLKNIYLTSPDRRV